MIIKKLAVPLINDKILSQAEHIYIATTAISEEAFDFLKNRLPSKCRIDIVTGLDGLTSPSVLRRVWRHYQDRITLKIYTRNFFHANVYIFDLPYRKSVAFLGSGHLTLQGIKDGEEIFYKITDAREIEGLMSWYTGYYEFSEPLTENIVREYERIYPSMHQRQIASREEKEDMIGLSARGFNWENIRFKNQYFKKEDYLTFSDDKASLNTAELKAERVGVKNKLLQIHDSIKKQLGRLGLFADGDGDNVISSLNPMDYPDRKLRSMQISYGRSEVEATTGAKADDQMGVQFVIREREVGIWLMIGKAGGSQEEREYFQRRMEEADYRTTFFNLLQGLGSGYRIQVAGEKKAVDSLQTPENLWQFVKPDDWRYYTFAIAKHYSPGDPEISSEKIIATFLKESDRLILLYRQLLPAPKEG